MTKAKLKKELIKLRSKGLMIEYLKVMKENRELYKSFSRDDKIEISVSRKVK